MEFEIDTSLLLKCMTFALVAVMALATLKGVYADHLAAEVSKERARHGCFGRR